MDQPIPSDPQQVNFPASTVSAAFDQDRLRPTAQDVNAVFRYATFWERFLAFSIDTILILIIMVTFAGLFPAPIIEGPLLLPNIGVYTAIPTIYFAVAYSKRGQTLGKYFLKIKVVSSDGSPLNWRTGLLRSFGYFTSNAFLDIGCFWVIWDPDKQAWHDKIAGTYVVKANESAEQLKNLITPAEKRRRQITWSLATGLPTILIYSLSVILFFSYLQKSLAEVRAMAPWPGPDITPQEVARLDLANIGLESVGIFNARDDVTYADGVYEAGELVSYADGNASVVNIWALRYQDSKACADDYQMALDWSQGNCATTNYSNWGKEGVIHCHFLEGYSLIMMNDHWLVDISGTSEQLVNQVRDTMSEHWKTLKMP